MPLSQGPVLGKARTPGGVHGGQPFPWGFTPREGPVVWLTAGTGGPRQPSGHICLGTHCPVPTPPGGSQPQPVLAPPRGWDRLTPPESWGGGQSWVCGHLKYPFLHPRPAHPGDPHAEGDCVCPPGECLVRSEGRGGPEYGPRLGEADGHGAQGGCAKVSPRPCRAGPGCPMLRVTGRGRDQTALEVVCVVRLVSRLQSPRALVRDEGIEVVGGTSD